MFWWKTIKRLRQQVLDLTRICADLKAKYEEEREHSRQLAGQLDGERLRLRAREMDNEILGEKIDEVEQNYRILKAAGERPTRRLMANVPPQDAAKLQENLAVEENNPVLQGVLCALRANLHIAMTRAAEPKQEDMKPGYYDGSIAFALDLEEDILRIREEGMAKKAGVKK